MIETTGLADPARILHTLMVDPAVTPHWRLEGVIATVDAVNGAHTLVAHEEAMKQAAVADRILLTKSDIASADQLTAAWHQLRSIAPGTPIIETIDGTVDPAAILAVGLYDAAGKIADVRAGFSGSSRLMVETLLTITTMPDAARLPAIRTM